MIPTEVPEQSYGFVHTHATPDATGCSYAAYDRTTAPRTGGGRGGGSAGPGAEGVERQGPVDQAVLGQRLLVADAADIEHRLLQALGRALADLPVEQQRGRGRQRVAAGAGRVGQGPHHLVVSAVVTGQGGVDRADHGPGAGDADVAVGV